MVDTSRHVDETLLSLFDAATKIVVVGTPTLAAIKNIKFVLDLFDQLTYPAEKTTLILNKVPVDRNRQKFTISSEKIEKFLKRPIEIEIPEDELTVLTAMSKGVLIVAQRDRSRSPVKELLALSELLYTRLMGDQTDDDVQQDEKAKQRKSPLGLRFGKA